jgi:hypothetical protein
MKAILSDTAPQRSSLASLSDVPIGSRGGSDRDGSALGELVEIGTACIFTAEGGLRAQIPGKTGQSWSVTVGRGRERLRGKVVVRAICAPKRAPNRK